MSIGPLGIKFSDFAYYIKMQNYSSTQYVSDNIVWEMAPISSSERWVILNYYNFIKL